MAAKKDDLPEIIRQKVEQRHKAHHEQHDSLFFGLGMFGTVGWSIAIPTLLGTLLGRWLDSLHHGSISWTLTCLLAGMALGCLVAWHWLNVEGGKK